MRFAMFRFVCIPMGLLPHCETLSRYMLRRIRTMRLLTSQRGLGQNQTHAADNAGVRAFLLMNNALQMTSSEIPGRFAPRTA